MKIGIIVFSQTGNTLSVAEEILQALKKDGRDVTLERIEVESEKQPTHLVTVPSVLPYDTVILAAPVQAQTLHPAMKTYLSQVSSLSGKDVHCFVTQHFKKPFLGGNRAVRYIQNRCKSKGAEIITSGIIHWSAEKRDVQILDLVKAMRGI